MANSSFRIKRIDDATIFRLFEKAEEAGKEALEDASGNGKFQQEHHDLNLSFSTLLPWQITREELRDAQAGQYVLSKLSLTFSAASVKKGHNPRDSVSFSFSRGNTDSLTDTFEISSSSPQNSLNGEGEQAVQRAIHTPLSSVLQPVAPEDGGLVPTLVNLSQAFDTTYRQIAGELSNAVSAVNQERADQIAEFQEERRQFREEMSDEREELLKGARETLESERRELDKNRQEIADERSKLEISSHKDARRKQFNQLQEHLAQSLSVPVVDRTLRTMRWAVFVALIAAGIAAAYFAYLSFNVATWEAAIPSSAVDRFSTTMMLVMRSVVLTAASLIAFFGAAAWMRYFYNRDLQAQEEMRRFRNDMARASWVMEASLEIRKEHNEEIPPLWIAGVTEGLFAASQKENMEGGAQVLAALMGLSAGANIGPNGMEVQLSRKGRKAIANAAVDT